MAKTSFKTFFPIQLSISVNEGILVNNKQTYSYLCCSWSQCDSYRHQSLFGIVRHGAKGGAEKHGRRLCFDILQFDL